MADKPRVTGTLRRDKPLTQPLIPRAMQDDLKQKVRQRRADKEKRKQYPSPGWLR